MLATDGLRDINLQRKLMATSIDWAELIIIVKPRAVAYQAVQVLDGGTESTMPFKKEVGVVTNITKSSSYSASGCCNNSSSHSINCMSEADRHAKGRRYDSSHDRSSAYRSSGSPSRRSDSYKLYYLLLHSRM